MFLNQSIISLGAGAGLIALDTAMIYWIVTRIFSGNQSRPVKALMIFFGFLKFTLLVGVVYFLISICGLQAEWFAGGVSLAVMVILMTVLVRVLISSRSMEAGRLKGA